MIVSTASGSFGDAVVDVINKVIELAPLPHMARTVLQAATHSVARAARSVWSFFFG
jgi:predicted GTPase